MQILETDLDLVEGLTKSNYEYFMYRFIAEVVKVDGQEYPGQTPYQMCVLIQKYLFSKGLKWKLIEGDFEKLHNVLDNVMKVRAVKGIDTIVKHAKFLSHDLEKKFDSQEC